MSARDALTGDEGTERASPGEARCRHSTTVSSACALPATTWRSASSTAGPASGPATTTASSSRSGLTMVLTMPTRPPWPSGRPPGEPAGGVPDSDLADPAIVDRVAAWRDRIGHGEDRPPPPDGPRQG